ncbi:unnamed protein product [Cylindrotheca closterium]|uniref:Uncharacterized protein n=1 Tax=Cylindrotheca closterium TaxID=2856 RepID=A0AAD2G389_9STRA|nr:unnamed protein product [Cylindrotheca closterium]
MTNPNDQSPSAASTTTTTNTTTTEINQQEAPNEVAWIYSFSAAMVPFVSFCYMHSKGGTARIVERVVRSPVGVYGLLGLPFVSLAMEKSIYDTVQSYQGINPNIRPADRGGFPSGGAALPSLSLIPVQTRSKVMTVVKRPTTDMTA